MIQAEGNHVVNLISCFVYCVCMEKIILLVASPGGHFVQLSLLAEGLSDVEIIAASTYETKPSFMIAKRYEVLPDFSRSTFLRIFRVLSVCREILVRTHPHLVVTTGAAPGLVMVVIAHLLGIKSIWIDSIANSRKLSLSGRIAQKIGIIVLSQWEEVAKQSGVSYEGRLV